MKTSYVIQGVDPKLCADRPEAITAALSKLTKHKIVRAQDQFQRGRTGFTPGHQPRDSTGRFRKILARLKFDLGDSELENIITEINAAEDASDAGDIAKATTAGKKVVQMVDEIKEGVLDAGQIKNVRAGAAELGRVLAYLPLPQGDENAKVRFSDLPGSTADLINNMVTRVEERLGEDAVDAVALLKSYMSGVRSMTADELSAELNKLLRLLT